MPRRELDEAAGPTRGPGLATVAGVVIAALALIVGLLLLTGVIGGGGFDAERISEVARDGGSDDPFSYTDERAADFERRAALGYSHVIYDKSPGGIVASARRTARWRDEIERAAAAHGVDPDLMEAIVLLESAGRPEVIAGDDPEVASGLAQIVASTGPDLLGMKVDLPKSRRADEADRQGRGADREGEAAGAEQEPEDAIEGPAGAPQAAEAGGGAACRARPDRRALRSREGARRHGHLPRDRQGELRPRRSRDRELPHGNRQSPGRPGPLRRDDLLRRRRLRAALLRLLAAAQRVGLGPARLLRRRQLHLPLAGAGGRADHGPLPERSRRAGADRRAADGQGHAGGGLPSRRTRRGRSPTRSRSRRRWTTTT